jgi:signal-transduction protein with cAMP-binding, CBS, and nucleotidyltransferase domain
MIDVQLLKSFSYFKGFTDSELELLLPFTTLKVFAPGEVILKEGKINTDLYFLALGKVTVSVADEQVAEISCLGEVLGEMSLGNHFHCTATVRAETPSTFVLVAFKDIIVSIPEEQRHTILMRFYKSTVEILTTKLMMTNALARTFESR